MCRENAEKGDRGVQEEVQQRVRSQGVARVEGRPEDVYCPTAAPNAVLELPADSR